MSKLSFLISLIFFIYQVKIIIISYEHSKL